MPKLSVTNQFYLHTAQRSGGLSNVKGREFSLVRVSCNFIANHDVFHQPLGVQPGVVVSDLNGCQLPEILALQERRDAGSHHAERRTPSMYRNKIYICRISFDSAAILVVLFPQTYYDLQH